MMDDESMFCNPQASSSEAYLCRKEAGERGKCADEREAKPHGPQAPEAKDVSTYY